MRKKSKKEILRGPAFDYMEILSAFVKEKLEVIVIDLKDEYKLDQVATDAARKWVFYYYVRKFPSATHLVNGQINQLFVYEAASAAEESTILLLDTLKYGWRIKWLAAAYAGTILSVISFMYLTRDVEKNERYYAVLALIAASYFIVISLARICYNLKLINNDRQITVSITNFSVTTLIFVIFGIVFYW
ncbi:MAG: hypothetical protein WCQ49_01695 [Candidatus Saccharibacteria bacterium]